MRGLDPRIHPLRENFLRSSMDCTATRACPSCAALCAASRVYPTCGVKPGNDGVDGAARNFIDQGFTTILPHPREAVGWAAHGARFVRVGKIACASCPRGNAMASDFAHPVDAARRERRWFQVPCASPIFDLSRFLAHGISSNILSFSAARE